MLRLASDADVNGDILRGLHLRLPALDLVRAQDHLAEGTSDPIVLAWAADAGRVLITNDRNTMLDVVWRRVKAGDPVPGVVATINSQEIGAAIDDIALITEYMPEDEMRNQVVIFLPFRG